MPAPATARVAPLNRGGIDVAVSIPLAGGSFAEFDLVVQRDGDDWRVVIPWSFNGPCLHKALTVPDARGNGREYTFVDGVAELTAPEVDEEIEP